MTIYPLHDWSVDAREAARIQGELREDVMVEDVNDLLGYQRQKLLVAGLDAHFPFGKERARGAAVLLEWSLLEGKLELVEQEVAEIPMTFPYIPGLLSFREAPALAAVLQRLRHVPDLLLADGHGLAHPRRFGLACHMGLLTRLPTIGVAKSILVGSHAWLDEVRPSWQPLVHRGEVVGAALRTASYVEPVYVSVGHLVTLPTALRAVLGLSQRFRLPEPSRLAHQAARGSRTTFLDT